MTVRSWITSLLVSKFLLVNTFLSYTQNIEVKKIWDRAPHNAFTDLIRYKSYFYCTFREGMSHVPEDTSANGKIRIIRSRNGDNWESVVLLESEKYDLRDPKLSVTPDKRLMVVMGGSHYVSGKLVDMLSHVSFSYDGINFTRPSPVSVENSIRSPFDWIWRVTWKGNTGYAVMYRSRMQDNSNRIMVIKTTDGTTYKKVSEPDIDSLPNEATIRFDRNNNMLILLRREANAKGMLGISSPPYNDWKWSCLAYRLGGPNFLVLKNNRLYIGSRLYQPGSAKTVIYFTDTEGNVEKTIELPSGGDTSYPGLLIFRNRLWISYYSGHEGKTSIYLAKIRNKDLLH